MRVLIFALLAGCGFPHGSAVDAAVTGDDVGVDARRDAMVDAEIDGDPNVDTDGDGVLDATDNCRLAVNADQHDEDADLVGDVCDLCPHVANSVTDTDGDKIGDACDPHPSVGGDVLVRFDSFKGNTLPAGWSIEAGTNFVVGGDVLTITATSTHIILFDTGNQAHSIDVGVQLPAAPGGTSFFTALTDVKNDIAQFFGCGLRLDSEIREFFTYDDPTFTTIGTDPVAADPPSFPGVFRVMAFLGPTTQTCTIPSAQNMHIINASAGRKNRQHVGLRAGGVTAQVRYVAIYRF